MLLKTGLMDSNPITLLAKEHVLKCKIPANIPDAYAVPRSAVRSIAIQAGFIMNDMIVQLSCFVKQVPQLFLILNPDPVFYTNIETIEMLQGIHK